MSYSASPPPFGHSTRDSEFAFKPRFINLNCGAYGAPPKKVMAYVHTLNEEIERSPDYFHRRGYQERSIEVRAKIAQHIGADTDEVDLVRNTTTGVNIVLRNFAWEKSDTLVTFSTTYPTIDRTAQYFSDVSPHPSRKIIPLLFPTTASKILQTFQSFASATRRAARLLGFNRMSAKRPVAALYVPFRNQHLIISSVPTSAFYVSPPGGSFLAQFQHNGAIDYANYLSILEALKFREWMGGEHAINVYCHDLALRGGELLKNKFGTELLDPTGEFTLNMANVKLPYDGPSSEATLHRFFEKLFENNAFSIPYHHNGFWWTRLSAQIWNDITDFEIIGDIWLKVIDEVKTEPSL